MGEGLATAGRAAPEAGERLPCLARPDGRWPLVLRLMTGPDVLAPRWATWAEKRLTGRSGKAGSHATCGECRYTNFEEDASVPRLKLPNLRYRWHQLRHRARFVGRGLIDYAALMTEENPARMHVAAVLVGRNDDYMPDFVGRLRATATWNAAHLAGEIVFVEWNPPPDRPLLSITLTEEFPNLKAYVVGVEIHDSLSRNDRLPLLEYHAKNVGIRRAGAPLVVATNADVAFGPDTIRRIRTWRPDDRVAWTAQRIDVSWRDFHRKSIGLMDCVRYRRMIPYEPLGTGDFLLATRILWHQVRGYDESLVKHRIGCDMRGAAQMRALGAEIRRIGTVVHLAHPTSCTEEVRPHHGEFAPADGIPYENGRDWGLGDRSEEQIHDRVWRLR